MGGLACSLGLLFLQKDLGPALILGLMFLGLYAIARGRVGMPIAGLVVLLAGFYISYRLHVPATVVERVRIWQSPWDNAVRGGDQVAHAIWSLASGASWGSGLGLGSTRYLPAGHTDLILASIGEELGACGLIVVTLFTVRSVACLPYRTSGSDRLRVLLAAGVLLLLSIPAILMACAMVWRRTLTGVVTPFLSYGGTAMAANFAALGILASIRANETTGEALAPFLPPLRLTVGAVAAAAAIPVALLVNIQVRQPDQFVVKPQLGLQADGSRRYEYNPRILDVVRQIPRGTITIAPDCRWRPTRPGSSRPRPRPTARSVSRSVKPAPMPQPGAIRSRGAPSFPRRRPQPRQLGAPATRHSSSATTNRGCADSTTTPWTSRLPTREVSRAGRCVATSARWCPYSATATSRAIPRSRRCSRVSATFT